MQNDNVEVNYGRLKDLEQKINNACASCWSGASSSLTITQLNMLTLEILTIAYGLNNSLGVAQSHLAEADQMVSELQHRIDTEL